MIRSAALHGDVAACRPSRLRAWSSSRSCLGATAIACPTPQAIHALSEAYRLRRHENPALTAPRDHLAAAAAAVRAAPITGPARDPVCLPIFMMPDQGAAEAAAPESRNPIENGSRAGPERDRAGYAGACSPPNKAAATEAAKMTQTQARFATSGQVYQGAAPEPAVFDTVGCFSARAPASIDGSHRHGTHGITCDNCALSGVMKAETCGSGSAHQCTKMRATQACI